MSTAKTELLAVQFEASAQATFKNATDIPENARYKQLKEGKAHPLWVMGHLCGALDEVTNHWILNGEKQMDNEIDRKFSPEFFGGLPITSDPDFYPSWDEVMKLYTNISAKTVRLIKGLTDEQLSEDPLGPIPDEARDFFGNVGQSLNSMLQHDAYHRGQMMLIVALND